MPDPRYVNVMVVLTLIAFSAKRRRLSASCAFGSTLLSPTPNFRRLWLNHHCGCQDDGKYCHRNAVAVPVVTHDRRSYANG